MSEHKCRFCVGEFLRGEERCSRCGGELESPIRDETQARARTGSEIFTPQHHLLNLERSSDGERDDRDLESILFDWKNPIVVNIVGSLVCALILIATLVELLAY